MKKIFEWIKAKLNIRSVVRNFWQDHKDQNMNNRDVAIDIYNRLNIWSHGVLTDFAVGIIEDELDMAFPEYEQINRNKTL